jgi:hypothetical protein
MKSAPLAEKPHPFWVSIFRFNIAILVAVFVSLTRPLLNRRRRFALAIIAAVIYTLPAGAGAPVATSFGLCTLASRWSACLSGAALTKIQCCRQQV